MLIHQKGNKRMVKSNFVTSYLVFLGAQSQHSGPQNDIYGKNIDRLIIY